MRGTTGVTGLASWPGCQLTLITCGGPSTNASTTTGTTSSSRPHRSNDTTDLAVKRRLEHLDVLQARARAVNRLVVETERVGQGCVLASPEIWLSILTRKALRRGEFTSRQALADKIIEFIGEYNAKARPFRWTYDGAPLKAA